MNRLSQALAILVAAAAAVAAWAQVSLPGAPLPQTPLPRLPSVTDPVTGTLKPASAALSDLRKLRVRELLRNERDTFEAGPGGQPVVRRQVGALSPSPAALERAKAAGFTLRGSHALEGLGVTIVVLEAPDGVSTRSALKRLRELDPEGEYDYNHVYLESGFQSETPAASPATPASPVAPGGPRIGLIDSGVDGSHPVLAGTSIVRHGCDNAVFAAEHGTAVASLLVGQGDGFTSVTPGATLYASDIFCGHGGGSLSLLAIALDWMARERVAVVNISLVGAKSPLLTGLVRAMTSRGFLLVAAVGNDGPSAPPLFPAAYPEVVGVTGVDANRKVLPEACRGEQVDFAAQGSNVVAAAAGGGFGEIRGTSFATPVVAGMLARSLESPDPAKAREALASLESGALDLGKEGPDPIYGNGLVGADFRAGRRD